MNTPTVVTTEQTNFQINNENVNHDEIIKSDEINNTSNNENYSTNDNEEKINNLQVENKKINLLDLNDLINRNVYIKNCKSNKTKDKNSLSYLIDKNLSQSDCIKLGIGIEKFLVDLVVEYSKLENIKEKNIKGQKEKDHLFIDKDNKIVYYSELKANINLDTEKSKTTYTKCLEIVKTLREEYSGYEIRWCLLALRYLHYSDVPKVIQGKYSNITENLYGVNQYLKMLGIEYSFTDESYKILLNKISDAMFD